MILVKAENFLYIFSDKEFEYFTKQKEMMINGIITNVEELLTTSVQEKISEESFNILKNVFKFSKIKKIVADDKIKDTHLINKNANGVKISLKQADYKI